MTIETEPRTFKSIRRSYSLPNSCYFTISDEVKDVIGVDKQIYRKRLLDKLKLGIDPQEHQELILYDNPEKTKRYILKSFIRFYLRNLLASNRMESCLTVLRERYEKLDSIQKITFRDIQLSIEEMERA